MNDIEIKIEIKEKLGDEPEEISMTHQESFVFRDVSTDLINAEDIKTNENSEVPVDSHHQYNDKNYLKDFVIEFEEEEETNNLNVEPGADKRFQKVFWYMNLFNASNVEWVLTLSVC